MRKKENKRGQVTVFIIIAIIIIVVGLLIYLFYPKISSTFGGSFKNPQAFMQECLVDDLEDSIKMRSLQGGSLNPEHYILYDDTKVEYLCYTNKYYESCVMQRPFLDVYFEEELEREFREEINVCLDEMKKSYENQGYGAVLQKQDFDFEIQLDQIVLQTNTSLRLSKETVQTYDSFRVGFASNLFDFISVAESILTWEIKYGDAETTIYMDAHRDLKVEKKKQTDGTTIYILTNRDTEDKFQFASRSVAWPPGFGGDE